MSTHVSEEFDKPQGKLPDGTPEPLQHPLVRFSVKNYVFSIGVFLMIVLLGLISAARLGVELLPNFEIPVLSISTSYPGANPDQVDHEVSRKVEEAVSTLSGVIDINTTSVVNQSVVVITFAGGTNIDAAANSVSQAVAAIRANLPSGTEAPVVQKFDPNDEPIMTLALLGAADSERNVARYADEVLKNKLQRIQGVAEVAVSGGPKREIQVLLDPALLQSHDLSPGQVSQAISTSALDLPVGSVTQGSQTTSLSTRNTPKNAADVAKVVLNSTTGLQVGDVSNVRDGIAKASSYARLNGQNSILLAIHKSSGTNSVAVAEKVRRAMEKEKLPAGYILTVADDTTLETKATLKDTFKEFIIAIAAVGLVCLLFLGRLSTVMAVVLAIPISISAAPLIFAAFGFTFNTISLLAIIVAIGIVVDDSIVVAENVQRYRNLGYSPIRSVLLGGSEVFSAVTAASFSLLAVLLPLSFMPGIIGQFFAPFALGIASAIVLSWLESLLFLTVRMAYTKESKQITWREMPSVLDKLPSFIRESFFNLSKPTILFGVALSFLANMYIMQNLEINKSLKNVACLIFAPITLAIIRYLCTVIYSFLEALTTTLHGITDKIILFTSKAYAKILNKLLDIPFAVVIATILFMMSAPIAFKGIGFDFVPKTDSGSLEISIKLPIGSSLDTTNSLVSQLEASLFKNNAVKLVQSSIGKGGTFGTSGSNSAKISVTLMPKGTRPSTDAVAETTQKALEKIASRVAGTRISVSSVQGGPGGSADISLALTASSQEGLLRANAKLMNMLAGDKNIKSLDSSLSETRQERTFIADLARLTGTGLTPSDVAQALRIYNDGSKAGTARDGDQSVDIVVKLDPTLIQDGQSLLTQTVYAPAIQANLPISQLGQFQASQTPATLSRYNKAYTSRLDININAGGPNTFAYQQEIIERAKREGILSGNVTLGNSSAFGDSGLTGDLVFYGPILMLISVILTYLVLGSQFNSFRYPLYLLMPMPLAIVGAIWSLKLFGVNLDVITVMGMVILLGLSTKNSILYLEFVTERARTLQLREALVEAAELRFRPILMTTLTVIVISIPLILGQGDGAELRKGIGIVILGGIITSTLLTFFVVPSVFWIIERRSKTKQAVLQAIV